MANLKMTVAYGADRIQIEAESLAELLELAAGIAELNVDYEYLLERAHGRVVPAYRIDDEGNDYFGFRDLASGANQSFGRKREKGSAVPFFPKRAEGFWAPQDYVEPQPTALTASPARPAEPRATARRPRVAAVAGNSAPVGGYTPGQESALAPWLVARTKLRELGVRDPQSIAAMRIAEGNPQLTWKQATPATLSLVEGMARKAKTDRGWDAEAFLHFACQWCEREGVVLDKVALKAIAEAYAETQGEPKKPTGGPGRPLTSEESRELTGLLKQLTHEGLQDLQNKAGFVGLSFYTLEALMQRRLLNGLRDPLGIRNADTAGLVSWINREIANCSPAHLDFVMGEAKQKIEALASGNDLKRDELIEHLNACIAERGVGSETPTTPTLGLTGGEK
ncbi:MAG: hypothetical protein AAGI08_00085 [Bacteroidota bacterium]